MGFSTKTDYTGLTNTFATALGLRDDNPNPTVSTYEPDAQDGSTLDIEVYGSNESPTNNLALLSKLTATAGQIELGKIVTVLQKKYRLKGIHIGTKVNAPVTISATSEMVEAGATDVAAKNFPVPAFELETDHLAQILFSAFSVSGNGANLIAADYDIALSISKDTLVGSIISNGAGKAAITAKGTVLCKGDTAPTVAAGSGFVLVSPLACQNPEAAYKSYTFTVKKILSRPAPQSAQ